eukprot:TRINITY_DN22134_c0_g1_i1.p1 TRINITY_DN22134_c0_g1~~TRINITY_DN22134_c0_g1_i1.p1  ORF type:complete len:243 (+),score=40.58 TRINITY_DN22134_c0_g1_i1:76-729(+)
MAMRAGVIAALLAYAAAQAPTNAPTAAPTSPPTFAPTPPSCFAMEATVQVEGLETRLPLAALQHGDRILANGMFTDVIGFLHNLGEASDVLVVEHAAGELRITGNHLLLVGGEDKQASAIKTGDLVALSYGTSSPVIAVRRDTAMGLVSPLTTSGVIDVDEVAASNYANAAGIEVTHAAMHAAFSMTRLASAFLSAEGTYEGFKTMPKLAGVLRMLS